MAETGSGMQRFERPQEVLVRVVGDEMVLLNTSTEQYHSLNEVGRRCFELLADGLPVDEAVAAITDEYETTEDEVRTDVQELLHTLLSTGLLQPVN